MNPTIHPKLAKQIRQHAFICGADEVGLGSWAGPLVVCAAVVPIDWTLPGLTDSKKLTAAQRETLYPNLVENLTHRVVEVSSQELDQLGMGRAWQVAHQKAVQGALEAHKALGNSEAPLVIIDGNRAVQGAVALPKADLLIPAVSAASVIAKVHRDRLMKQLAETYPGYGFNSNVGYGTAKHQEGLDRLGVTPVHRMSYSPMSQMKAQDEPDIMDLMNELDT